MSFLGFWRRTRPSIRRSPTAVVGALIGSIAVLAGMGGVRALIHTGAAFEARAWPTVAATIVRSELGEDTLTTNLHRYGQVSYTTATTFSVAYTYVIAGDQLTGSRLDATGSRGIGEAHQLLARYPRGAAVVVHVSREDPASAVLEAPWPVKPLLSCIFELTASVFLSWVAYRSSRPERSPPNT